MLVKVKVLHRALKADWGSFLKYSKITGLFVLLYNRKVIQSSKDKKQSKVLAHNELKQILGNLDLQSLEGAGKH